MRIMVTGSRTWSSRACIEQALFGCMVKYDGLVVIAGGAPGADRLAAQVCEDLGVQFEEYPADWDGLGPKAGFVRNQAMIEMSIDGVVAFWDGTSKGTRHAVDLAVKRGITVWLFMATGEVHKIRDPWVWEQVR